jgi:hypothetical protein
MIYSLAKRGTDGGRFHLSVTVFVSRGVVSDGPRRSDVLLRRG